MSFILSLRRRPPLRVLLLLYPALAFATCAAAQLPAAPATLLWRVTGKGLTKPSYLYGTMHLSDKRLFQFGDSVYRAIEQTEGLAMEVNPDEMVAYYINKGIDEAGEKPKRLSNLLSAEDYDAYSEALSDKLNKPADEITAKDILNAKNSWVAEYLTKGEMPTFVDAFLYNIARRQGKWVGGIEDLADQIGMINDGVDKADVEMLVNPVVGGKSYIEEMIRLYTAQDLDGIERITARDPDVDLSAMLYRRNIKMARRMDSLSRQRSMFFAVGAAHLPGDSGVIRHLRQRGFTVTPVFSQHKTDGAAYTYNAVPAPWYDVADADGYYTAQMPGNPVTVKMYGVIETKALFDLYTMAGYCTLAMMRADGGLPAKDLYAGMAANMFGGRKDMPFKEVSRGVIAGREYTGEANGTRMRVQLFVQKGVVYMAMAYGFKKAALTNSDAERFFASFSITGKAHDLAKAAPAVAFSDSILAVGLTAGSVMNEIPMPGADDNATQWATRGYAAADPRNEIYEMLIVQSVKGGYALSDDTAASNERFEQLAVKYQKLNKKPYMIGPYRGIEITGTDSGSGIRAIAIPRGNRLYLALAIGDTARMAGPAVQAFLSSLRFLPYRAPVLQTQADSGRTFSTLSPSAIRFFERSNYSSTARYTAFDSNSSTSFTVSADTLGAYTWYASDSLAWAEQLSSYYSPERDTIVSVIKNKAGADDAREWTLQNKTTGKHARVRIVKHGRLVYTLYSAGEREVMEGAMCRQFFGAFRVRHPAESHNWLQSRRDEMLIALSSDDINLRERAAEALRSATFSRKDLPALHAALLRTYRTRYSDDTTDAINVMIGDRLAALADTTTLRFIAAQYPALTGRDSFKRHTAILALAKMQTPASYRLLAMLLTTQPTGGTQGYDLTPALCDSMALLHTIYPRLLTLAKDREAGALVATIARRLADSGLIRIEDLRKSEADFIAYSTYIVKTMQADTEAYYYPADLMALLGRFNSEASIAALRNYFTLSRRGYFRLSAALEIIRQDGAVDTAVLRGIAADSSLRLALYNGLKELGRKRLFPKRYFTQRHFARSLVYEAVSDLDDDEVETIRFLRSRVVKRGGTAQRFYLYNVTLAPLGDEAPKSYLGVAGGFNPDDETAVLPAQGRDISGIYMDDAYRPVDEEALFYAYIMSTEIGRAIAGGEE